MNETTGRRWRSLAVAAPSALLLAAACGAPAARGVCEDPRTGLRVNDIYCQGGYPGGGYDWVYFNSGSRYPAVGQRVVTIRSDGSRVPVKGGTLTAPKGAEVIKGGAAVKGGTVARGIAGGGGHAKGVGG